MQQHMAHLHKSMPEYRLYFLDANGRIRSAQTIEAVDDECALFLAAQVERHGAGELWQRARRVAILGAESHVS